MPRKYGYRIEWFPKLHRSFNEAGADAPEIQGRHMFPLMVGALLQ